MYLCLIMNNLRFATAIHILVLLDKNRNELITSDFIAGSLNVHPVVVRREIKVLREAGYIESKKGKEGGCTLAMEANKILLGDLYKLVNKENMLGRKNRPNPDCAIGRQMNNKLDVLFNKAEEGLVALLNKQSLKDFSDSFE